jgi:hypothetical protein
LRRRGNGRKRAAVVRSVYSLRSARERATVERSVYSLRRARERTAIVVGSSKSWWITLIETKCVDLLARDLLARPPWRLRPTRTG